MRSGSTSDKDARSSTWRHNRAPVQQRAYLAYADQWRILVRAMPRATMTEIPRSRGPNGTEVDAVEAYRAVRSHEVMLNQATSALSTQC